MRNRTADPSSSVLAKVRGLLAKAESTTFVAEAEALTAKAQELMSRHRIEAAILDAGGSGPASVPVARRIGVDDPYADAKSLLLSSIATANGCAAVWSRDERTATVFGFEGDLTGAELLFTSLLVQTASALHRAGPQRDGYGRSRTRRFRRSFLIAFAVRVGQRLRAVAAETAEGMRDHAGDGIVPILARRDAVVRAAAGAAFPHTRPMSTSASDIDGWRAGTAFGDQVDLDDAGGRARLRPAHPRGT